MEIDKKLTIRHSIPNSSKRYRLPAWWRAKIGAITPSLDLVSFQEQQTLFPKGVLLLHTRIMLRESTPEELLKLSDEAIYAAELLGTAKPDVISYNCTASAIMQGIQHEADIIRQMEEVSGAKGTSMALSVIEALNFLNVKEIVLVCPYLKEIVCAEEKYLNNFGFNVIYSETLSIADSLLIFARPPWENYYFALNAARKAPEAEALFISCGAMRTIEIIEYLECVIRKPVLSSNLCNAWNCLRLAGIKDPIYGYGSLLARER